MTTAITIVVTEVAGGVLTAEQAPDRPDTAPALGLRAGLAEPLAGFLAVQGVGRFDLTHRGQAGALPAGQGHGARCGNRPVFGRFEGRRERGCVLNQPAVIGPQGIVQGRA
jgi:hypothetical protein